MVKSSDDSDDIDHGFNTHPDIELARKLSSDDIDHGFNTHPDIELARKLSREVVTGEDTSLGQGLAESAKLPVTMTVGSGVSTAKVSKDMLTGLPGGNETLPSADPNPTGIAGREENHQKWQARLGASSVIVKRTR